VYKASMCLDSVRKYFAFALFAAATVVASAQDIKIYPTPTQEGRDYWYSAGQKALKDQKSVQPRPRRAKNIILFVGDGMGVSTVSAARILESQLLRQQSGEENLLSFERFPYVALSRTYSANQQTPDSAPTMTAMVTGVKTKDGILSLDQTAIRAISASVTGNELKTILEIAEERGKSTGVVSTARVTHATPGACYAHTPERDWESDSNIPAGQKPFPDIARQLLEFKYGDGLEVALGGGRSYFLRNTDVDPEYSTLKGNRTDGRNLTSEWVAKYPGATYVWNKAQFDAIDPASTNHLLGLFERSHMQYEYDRATGKDGAGEPSLSEMTVKAIDILNKNPKGYFLHVESGRIDHGHHAANAYRALTDTIEFSNAIRAALQKVDLNDTLIIVTADHSHVFTIAGYPVRGNDILGKVVSNDSHGFPAADFSLDMLGLPYTTLSYANGPGYTGASNSQSAGPKTFEHLPSSYSAASGRPDLRSVNTTDPSFLQESVVPLSSETHSGEDVAIYAIGPNSDLFQGVKEQNYIFHVMLDALRP
jgi:alkaline phosphatase